MDKQQKQIERLREYCYEEDLQNKVACFWRECRSGALYFLADLEDAPNKTHLCVYAVQGNLIVRKIYDAQETQGKPYFSSRHKYKEGTMCIL